MSNPYTLFLSKLFCCRESGGKRSGKATFLNKIQPIMISFFIKGKLIWTFRETKAVQLLKSARFLCQTCNIPDVIRFYVKTFCSACEEVCTSAHLHYFSVLRRIITKSVLIGKRISEVNHSVCFQRRRAFSVPRNPIPCSRGALSLVGCQ